MFSKDTFGLYVCMYVLYVCQCQCINVCMFECATIHTLRMYVHNVLYLIEEPASGGAPVVVTDGDLSQSPKVWRIYCKLVLCSTLKVVFVTVQTSLPFGGI